MTPRERWLAAVRFEPVDRLPFWPKLDAAYPPAQTPPFSAMSIPEIHGFIGSDQHIWLGSGIREVRKKTSVETEADGRVSRTVYRTPTGQATSVNRFDRASRSWHPTEFPVKTVEDVRTLTEWFDDAAREVDARALETARAARRKIGDGGGTAEAIGESPLMYLVEWLAGVENAHLLLADHPSQVEELFETIHRGLVERTRLLCECSPADMLYMGENTSTTLISPAQYRRYCVPHVTAYGEIMRDSGRPLVLHMCGHLRDILPDLARLPVAGFEAFTSPTVGNTTLAEGRAACPDKCLIGGTNAVLWTRPAGEIIAGIERDLDALPHHRGIVVTSAGVMPPACGPETIREVCNWVKSYPARM